MRVPRIQAGSPQPDALTLTAFAVVVLMAGANVVAVRFSNRELAPFWGAALHFLLADILLLALVLSWRLPLARGRGLVGAVAYGGALVLLGVYTGALLGPRAERRAVPRPTLRR